MSHSSYAESKWKLLELFLLDVFIVLLLLHQSESESIPSVLSCALRAADMFALGVCGSVTRGRDERLALGWSVFVLRRAEDDGL